MAKKTVQENGSGRREALDQAMQAIKDDREQRVQAATEQLQDLCKEHQVTIVPVVRIVGSNIEASVTVLPLEDR